MPAACPLPADSSLHRYLGDGGYVDCYATDIRRSVSQSDFIAAFYTTWLFKLERWVLRWAANCPSTDDEAGQLGRGTLDHFAAWQVESCSDRQLLMRDFTGRTRSWLMSTPGSNGSGTRLYFGSAVIPRTNPVTGKRSMGFRYRALLGFHKLYSRMLLRAARSRLQSGCRPAERSDVAP